MTLDFEVYNSLNSKIIRFEDTSVYDVAPISPTLHIKFPDFKKIYSTPIAFGSINFINTAMLAFSEYSTEFADGIYEFVFEVNNRKCEVKKKVFITAQAYSKLNKMLEKVSYDNYNKDLLEKFYKISLYLQGAEASVCDEQKASALYKQADNLLKC